MREVLAERARMERRVHIDDDVESRILLRNMQVWRLVVEEMSAFAEFRTGMTAESEVG